MCWRGTKKPVFFFFISLSSVIVQLCQGEECKNMNFLPEDKGGYLQNHTNENVTTDTQVVCRMLCYLSRWSCTSYNYQQSTGVCEMNDSDHIQHPDDLIRRDGFVYHSTKNDCQTKRCPPNTTCVANFVSGGSRCLCPLDYVGTPSNGCEFPYQKVGCFNDKTENERALPVLILTHRASNHPAYEKPFYGNNELYTLFIESMRWFISRCAIKTREKGFHVFGIQHYYECWTGPGGENSYSKHGEADQTKCDQGNFTKDCDKTKPEACYGLEDANYVYKLL